MVLSCRLNRCRDCSQGFHDPDQRGQVGRQGPERRAGPPGFKDAYHRPREPVITEAAKAWVVHLACSKPKEYGYAAELWTRESLARHVRQQAVARRTSGLGTGG